jgi:hypothetical protein
MGVGSRLALGNVAECPEIQKGSAEAAPIDNRAYPVADLQSRSTPLGNNSPNPATGGLSWEKLCFSGCAPAASAFRAG